MKKIMYNFIFLTFLLTNVSLFAQVPKVKKSSIDSAWLKNTSLSNRTTCPQASLLYRGMTGNFFTIEKAIENMLGDSLAELPSWRLSSIYKTFDKNGKIDEINWENAKKIAASELNLLQKKYGEQVCNVANYFAELTMQGHNLNTRSKSLGIAFTPNKAYAAGYIGAKIYVPSFDKNEILVNSGILIGIKEHISRAGYASAYGNQNYEEFYVPIFVPKEDIFAAWTEDLHIEKTVDSAGNLKVELYLVKNAFKSLKFNVPLDETLIAEIVQCPNRNEFCESDLPHEKLEGIWKSLNKLNKRGFHFKLIAVNP